MSGGGKGVCAAVAVSNAITNLYATIFGHFYKLEPLPVDKRTMWRREMDCLLSVCDHIVEFYPCSHTLSDGTSIEAFTILSRAIESHPTSAVLWVIYLHIFYMKEEGIGKDDMFLHAVQHNPSSYELWLMYINSRVKLVDRLNAYKNALKTLCQAKVVCDEGKRNRSAHVLDIFLQMLDCLCMCGNVDKALWRIYQLVPSSDSELSSDSILPDLLFSLTVPDQCIFWICCIYVVMYKKVPQEVVHNFELEKDFLFQLEWPFIQLSIEERNMVGDLMKLAVEKVGLDVDKAPQGRDRAAHRSLHFLAVCHVRLAATLNGFQHSEELLVNYFEIYPTCLELLLLTVRSHENFKFDVFWRSF